MTSTFQTCFTPGELLENIPGSCQHCVVDYFSQVLLRPWTSFINFVFHTSPQISHMKSHRVNDTGHLNTMSPKTLHMTTTELVLYDQRHCHVGRICSPCPYHLNFQKVVRKKCPMYLSPVTVSEKKIVLIIPVALTAHHAPPLHHTTAPRVLLWDYMPNSATTTFIFVTSYAGNFCETLSTQFHF
jgi:hypothetical protein